MVRMVPVYVGISHFMQLPSDLLSLTCYPQYCFFAPDVHLRGLDDIFVDNIIGHLPWTEFMSDLINEWEEFTLYATVLLAANVGFLGIQSVDTAASDRTSAQLSSYGSIVASLGSMILGLLLKRQNRTKDRKSAQEAADFLDRMRHPYLGLETLAIMYSLPYSLLMWGIVSFLVAFCFLCFKGTSIGTCSFVGTASVALFVLVFWSIWASWESGEHHWQQFLSRIYESGKAAIQANSYSDMRVPVILVSTDSNIQPNQHSTSDPTSQV